MPVGESLPLARRVRAERMSAGELVRLVDEGDAGMAYACTCSRKA